MEDRGFEAEPPPAFCPSSSCSTFSDPDGRRFPLEHVTVYQDHQYPSNGTLTQQQHPHPQMGYNLRVDDDDYLVPVVNGQINSAMPPSMTPDPRWCPTPAMSHVPSMRYINLIEGAKLIGKHE